MEIFKAVADCAKRLLSNPLPAIYAFSRHFLKFLRTSGQSRTEKMGALQLNGEPSRRTSFTADLQRRFAAHSSNFLKWAPAYGIIGIAILVFLNLIPQSLSFEGVLDATAVSFSTSVGGDDERSFLTRQVSSFTLTSLPGEDGPIHAVDMKIGGTISGATLDGIPQPQLNARTSFPLRLDGESLLQMSAPATSSLGLKLQLPPHTDVRDLSYDEHTSTLSFGIRPPSKPKPTLTITPPSDRSLMVALNNASALSGLRLPSSRPVNFLLSTSEFTVPIEAPARFRLKLADPPGIDLFPQSLLVSKVNFSEEIRSSSYAEVSITKSTLLGGALYLGRQEGLSVRPDQWLSVQAPGITELSFLRILLPKKVSSPTIPADQHSSEEQARLTVGVVGTSPEIGAGLSQKNPTSFRRGSVLSWLLAPDQQAALNSFMGGILSGLVLVLFNKR